MTPEALAALHARCFVARPRPWSAAEFAAMLAGAGVFLSVPPEGFALAFALGRVAGPEAELLTLAVAPEARRAGIGAALLAAFEAEAAARGAEEAWLEVSVENAAGRALYARAGWIAVGRRPHYYADGPGPATDALALRKPLRGAEGKTN